ncbi:MAG: SRPBCC family protein [Acidimicrobiia bacterium]|nr:SRPBCC family protein [Acidimicrobiia bacterium]
MVRLADGPVVEVSVDIAAPPERVWELVSDINLPARFQDEFKRAEWATDGPALGAEFVGYNERKGFQWDTSSWVVEYVPLRSFGWAVSDPNNPGATWTFRLSETPAGTRLTFHRRLGPGPSGLTASMMQSSQHAIPNRPPTCRAWLMASRPSPRRRSEALIRWRRRST